MTGPLLTHKQMNEVEAEFKMSFLSQAAKNVLLVAGLKFSADYLTESKTKATTRATLCLPDFALRLSFSIHHTHQSRTL
jgi:hypothetical protein